MTNEELKVYSNMLISHYKLTINALDSKADDIDAMSRNSLSAETTTEVTAAHDAAILNLQNTVPTEQDAIDAVAAIGEPDDILN